MDTPHVDEFMVLYNACVGMSNYAKVIFCDVTGNTALRKSATRWFSAHDVQELSIMPNVMNGKILQWVDRMGEQGICEKTVPKLRKFLLAPRKMKLFQLELIVVVSVGKGLKARNTKLEGDTFEFLHCYDTIVNMGEGLKHPMTPELTAAITKLASDDLLQAPAIASAAPAPAAAAPLPTPVQVLESLTPAVFKTVNVSMKSSFWTWGPDGPPQPRFMGKPTSWFDNNKTKIRIKWELGRDDDGNPQLDDAGKLKYAATKEAECATLLQHGLQLEPFDDGAPAPTLPEAPIEPEPVPVSDTHLIANGDLSDKNVLVALARAVVSPAAKYHQEAMGVKRGAQLERAKAVRFFDPLHVKARASEVTEEDIEGLSIFRLYKHPKIGPKIQVDAGMPTCASRLCSCLMYTLGLARRK